MAIHHPTPPLGGGERPCLPSAQGGPVTIALAAMRAADPDLDRQRLRELRRRIADRIEADIALLDALDGDPDAEPSLGAPEPIIEAGFGLSRNAASDQANWADGALDDREQDAGDEGEEENEHGGDVQDEPHDEEPDWEPDFDGERDTAPEWAGEDEHVFNHGGLCQ